MVTAFVQTAAIPTRTEKTSADMTGMICGISSWKATAGSSRRPSAFVTIDRFGMIAYPAAMDMQAASTLDT